ncbi:MAG: tRNA lysidine(34) synthetase TilS [Propionibacteriales bacterium]|nr:tRNA lysidine(34) synthetase TilS [Propionibacteriales bacterium]
MLDPAVADTRRAVRSALTDLSAGDVVVVACSGGADSLSLAAAAAFESRSAGWLVGAVTVDHGLQHGSTVVAERVASTLSGLGLDPVEVVPVTVGDGGGPEAAARSARYAALDAAADRLGASAVLLGHTRDDQAETVLLGLARGSGARSLSGMPPAAGIYRRPLLGLSRSTTTAACAAQGLEPWHDPHNVDPAYTRVRVRHDVLPVLEHQLGPGVAAALARTAALLRADADALDDLARQALADCRTEDGLDTDRLESLAPAVRSRVLRLAALRAGCPGTDLFAVHLDAVDALVTDWRGQRWVDLPGAVRALRAGARLRFEPSAVAG